MKNLFEKLKLERTDKLSNLEKQLQTQIKTNAKDQTTKLETLRKDLSDLMEKTEESTNQIVHELTNLAQNQLKLQGDVQELVKKEDQVFGSNRNIVNHLIQRTDTFESRLAELETNVFVLSKDKFIPQAKDGPREPKEGDTSQDQQDSSASTMVTFADLNTYLSNFDISLRQKTDIGEVQLALDSMWKKINHHVAKLEMRINNKLDMPLKEIQMMQENFSLPNLLHRLVSQYGQDWHNQLGNSSNLGDDSKRSGDIRQQSNGHSKDYNQQELPTGDARKFRYPGSKHLPNTAFRKASQMSSGSKQEGTDEHNHTDSQQQQQEEEPITSQLITIKNELNVRTEQMEHENNELREYVRGVGEGLERCDKEFEVFQAEFDRMREDLQAKVSHQELVEMVDAIGEDMKQKLSKEEFQEVTRTLGPINSCLQELRAINKVGTWTWESKDVSFSGEIIPSKNPVNLLQGICKWEAGQTQAQFFMKGTYIVEVFLKYFSESRPPMILCIDNQPSHSLSIQEESSNEVTWRKYLQFESGRNISFIFAQKCVTMGVVNIRAI